MRVVAIGTLTKTKIRANYGLLMSSGSNMMTSMMAESLYFVETGSHFLWVKSSSRIQSMVLKHSSAHAWMAFIMFEGLVCI